MTERPKFNDKTLACLDCGHDFVWLAGEQGYYFDMRLAQPKRCPRCRKTKREAMAMRQAMEKGDTAWQ